MYPARNNSEVFIEVRPEPDPKRPARFTTLLCNKENITKNLQKLLQT